MTKPKAKIETVTFGKPMTFGGSEVTEVTLREPTAGELRGIKITEVIQGEPKAVSRVVTRVATPAPTEEEVAALPLSQFMDLYQALVGFFADPEELAAL